MRAQLVTALILGWTQGLTAQDTAHVVLVGTTDVHGRAYHWDYVNDREAPWGLTRAATVVDSLRRAYPRQVVLADAGDLIQGNPFAAYFAKVRPTDPHPVIDALNAVGFDVGTPGNHEFNFGLEILRRAFSGASYAIVSGNIYHLPGDTAAFPPHVMLERDGAQVGVTGFTTPGTMIWDRDHLSGRLLVRRILPEAQRALGRLDDAGADLKVVVIHSGMGSPSSYDSTGVGPENVAARLANLPVKPHLVLVGHSHRRLADSIINGVHFMQPAPWARSLAVAHVWLVTERPVGNGERAGRFRVVRIVGEEVSLAGVPPQPKLVRRIEGAHSAVREWVDAPLATAEGDWSARYARAGDTPIIDLINEVQRRHTGADLSSTAAFNPAAELGPGAVRLRDVAGVYPYENTLKVIEIDGAALKQYLEQSAAYFRTYRPGESVLNDGVPGYNFDIVSGVDYVVDLRHPVGARIRDLTWQGRLVAPTDTFSLALNNYRQGGGGGFDMLRGLPVIYDRGENIRDLLAEWIRNAGSLRTGDYFTPSWRIVPPAAADEVRAAFRPLRDR